MKLSNDEVTKRLTEIAARMEWMSDNLEGCDWCCGGGDDEMEELKSEQDSLADNMLRNIEAGHKTDERIQENEVCYWVDVFHR